MHHTWDQSQLENENDPVLKKNFFISNANITINKMC